MDRVSNCLGGVWFEANKTEGDGEAVLPVQPLKAHTTRQILQKQSHRQVLRDLMRLVMRS